MLRKLYLHIGLEKTGTTSIQNFLALNKQALLEQSGIWTPSVLGHQNHKLLAAYGFDPGSKDVCVTSAGIGPAHHDVQRFREKTELTLARDLEGAKAEVGIISSEDLSRLFKFREINRIVDLLNQFAEQIEIILFLKRQDLLASSRFFSIIIGGASTSIVIPPPGAPENRYYNFHSYVGMWMSLVGDLRTKVCVIPSTGPFDSVSEFCKMVGIDISSFQMSERVHTSLDGPNLMLFQKYTAIADDCKENERYILIDELRKLNAKKFKFIIGKDEAWRFYRRFIDSNELLFSFVGGEATSFDEDFSMYPAHNMRDDYLEMVSDRAIIALSKFVKRSCN